MEYPLTPLALLGFQPTELLLHASPVLLLSCCAPEPGYTRTPLYSTSAPGSDPRDSWTDYLDDDPLTTSLAASTRCSHMAALHCCIGTKLHPIAGLVVRSKPLARNPYCLFRATCPKSFLVLCWNQVTPNHRFHTVVHMDSLCKYSHRYCSLVLEPRYT